jgi:hypothetical protein
MIGRLWRGWTEPGDAPVIEPEAARLLKRYEPRAEHYDAPVTP